MALLKKFDTPASLRDVPISSAFYDQWHNYVDELFGSDAIGENGGAFYNPARTDVEVAGEKTMTWNVFPRRVLLPVRRDKKREAYKTAEIIRDNDGHAQDEYFEWFVHKEGNKIRKITFTTEFRWYYEMLWLVDQYAVLKIYKKHVSPSLSLIHI